jgi:iron complex outermembrane receptor protein
LKKIGLQCVLSTCLTSALFSTAATAQAAQSDTLAKAEQLEEIVVTAERREADLQQTTVSMLALSAEKLALRNVMTLQDLSFVSPQLQIQPHPNSSNTLSLYLRGVGNSDEQVLQDPSVGVYVNGVYLPRNQGLNLDLLDLERVETLRGPQGTLYGRNATGGAINIITPAPGADLQAKILQSIGSSGHRRTVATLNMPLTHNLALRLNQGEMKQQGHVDNPNGAVSRFGDIDRQSRRADLLWSVSDQISARYSFEASSADDTPAYIAAVPLFPAKTSRPQLPASSPVNLDTNHVDSEGHSLIIDWQIGSLWAVKSITATRSLADSQSQNFHQGVFSAAPLLVTTAFGEHRMRSQEIQLSGQVLNNLSLISGLYLFEEHAWRNSGNLTPANNRRTLVAGRGIRNQSLAGFARIQWTPDMLSNRILLTGGVRLSDDRRRANLQRGIENVVTGVITTNPQLYSGQRRFRNVSPELVVEYALGDTGLLYAKTSRGYKSGGFNARASSAQRFSEGFDDELLQSSELGFKSEWWQRRLRINTALFYGAYTDIQLNVQSDPQNIVISDILNAGGAAISGLELDISWLAKPWLQFDLNCSQLRSNLYEVRNAKNQNVADDYRIIGAPKISCSGTADYSKALASGADLFASMTYRYQSDVFGSSTVSAGEYRIPAYGILNIQSGIKFNLGGAAWQISYWMRNAGDKQYYASHFNGGSGRVVPSAIFGSGKTTGLDVTLFLE